MQRVRRAVDEDEDIDFLSRKMAGSYSPTRSPRMTISPGANGAVNCIQHTVSRFDTLAGVAIKYGVEVADIKKLNALATDLQMFALKTLQIPLPGRHPPSPSLCNGHSTPQRPNSADQIPPRHRQNHLFDSFQSLKLVSCSERKVSPAMSTLQGYYGLRQPDPRASQEGFEIGVYHDPGTHLQDVPICSSSPLPNPPLGHHRKSRSVAHSLMSASGSLFDTLSSKEGENSAGTDKSAEKLLRRRQKSETDFSSCPPDKLLKEDISNIGGAISTITGKCVALRPKSASRPVSGMDGELLVTTPFPPSLGDPHLTDSMNAVGKSSSTSSLQDTDNGAFSSIWPTSKWSLKPDFQALSSAAIPIFDGLPKSIGKKNKAALD